MWYGIVQPTVNRIWFEISDAGKYWKETQQYNGFVYQLSDAVTIDKDLRYVAVISISARHLISSSHVLPRFVLSHSIYYSA